MHDDEPIEGEYSEEPSPERALERRQQQQAVVFNPLDAEPITFRAQLERRQANYDQLAMHLRDVLIPGKDFGRIHVMPKSRCERPWECTIENNPRHFSDWTLFASGADKILGILGLAVEYPDLQDYKRAVLKGMALQEVISDAHIVGHNGQVIASGAGACERSEVSGSLNNMIKKAAKRGRLDAVKRLPVVSALFEADFLAQIVADEAAKKGGNSTTRRAQTVNPGRKWDTGAKLAACPIGTHHKGKPWREIPTDWLQWAAEKCQDKPDVHRAVVEELSKRQQAAPGSSSIRTPPSPDFPSRDTHQHEGPDNGTPFNDDIPF